MKIVENKRVTIWIKLVPVYDKDGNYLHTKEDYNHFELGYVYGKFPKPLDSSFTGQNSWKSENWLREFGILSDGNLIIIPRLAFEISKI